MNQLGLFAKFWRPGDVKTRLANHVGAQRASRIYHEFVCTLTTRLRDCGDRRVLAYTPENSRDQFSVLAGDSWSLEVQSGDDLGQRMQRHFSAAFNAGACHAVLVGSDSPTLPTEFVDRAFQLLDDYDVVLGPTRDGGYYLVGASQQVPPIFEGVAWSTSSVWSQTVKCLQRAQIEFAQLPIWYDVDDISDLVRLRDELGEMCGSDPLYKRLLEVVSGP